MGERPTGTVTFLFTDIEGSTRLWEQHPADMRDALAAHDGLLEREIEEAGGFVHSTAGDAYSAAFADPLKAIDAAVSAQQALAENDWGPVGRVRVRMAVHTGVAHEREDDYYGPALNRCARILSAAHGGQVVTSGATEELVRHRLTPDMGLKDLGEHHLKDLGYPERIFQVIAPGLDTEFAALVTLDPSLNNLPLQLTSFVGREDELEDVRKRLADTRLLTLTGVGGSGKTRLSLQVAAETAEHFTHGVWLAELASVSDPDKLPAFLAEALRINRGQGGVGSAAGAGESVPVMKQIVDYLERRQALVILDNCEHLISATAELATHLLRNCPDVKLLATSREGLGIAGETLWQVPSMEMPSRFDIAELGGSGADALRLFAERAAAVNPAFEVTAETYPFVLKICRRLDGMPLAIELAAARARSMSVSSIADRIDDRFRLLTGGSRTALPRQQTLAAAIDWSYDLLDEAEQVFFQRLAAFRGGFTLEAAERVCAGGQVDEYDMVDYLSSLVDKSMVVWEGSGDRYRLLETLRQYAMDKLKESGEADIVRRAHAEHFLEVAEKAAPHLRGRDQVEWMERLEADHENFRAALAFTDEHDLTPMTARLAAALHWFWVVRNHYEEQHEWLGPLLGRPDLGEESTVLELMIAYAWHLIFSSQLDILSTHLVDTQGMARRLGDMARLAQAGLIEGWMWSNRDDYDKAEKAMDVGLETALASGDPWHIGWAAYGRGWVDRMRADVEAATPHFELALSKMRQVGDTYGLAWAAAVGAVMARYRLDYPEARKLHEESLGHARALGDRNLEAFNYACLGIVEFHEGHYEESIVNHQRCADIERDIGVIGAQVAENLHLLAAAQFRAGKTTDALASITTALNLLDGHSDYSTVLAGTLEALAEPLLDRGEACHTASLWGWAMAIRQRVGRAVPPPSRGDYAVVEERIAAGCPEHEVLATGAPDWAYQQALVEGRRAVKLIESTIAGAGGS